MEETDNRKVYIITIIVASLMVVLFGYIMKVWGFSTTKELFAKLSDTFLIPGILLLAYGIIRFAGNHGFFDGFGYSKNLIRRLYSKDIMEEKEDYYEYKVKKALIQREFIPYILIGGILLVLSVICIIVYSNI